MELLIPGLILVGLMVYASTRIKRNAARAFEQETIETPEFTLTKPDGMLHVINGDPRYAFEAYSKEFGNVGRRDTRLATATVEITDVPVDRPDEQPVSELNEIIGEHHYRITESVSTENGAEYRVFRKGSDRDGRAITLEVKALSESPDELVRKLESMVDSFTLS